MEGVTSISIYLQEAQRGESCWYWGAKLKSSPMSNGKMHVFLYFFSLFSWIHIPRSNCFGIANCDTDLSWESRDDGSLTVGARRNSTSDAIMLLSVSHTCGAPLLHFLWFSVERESRLRTRELRNYRRDRWIIIGKVYIRAVTFTRARKRDREKKVQSAWKMTREIAMAIIPVRGEIATYNGSD